MFKCPFENFTRGQCKDSQICQKSSSINPNHDEENGDPNQASSKYRNKTSAISLSLFQYLILLLLSIITILLTTMALQNTIHTNSVPSSPSIESPTIDITPCGNTPKSAKAAGCTFDIISFSWLPPACYNAELAAEFSNLKDWSYWLDQNKTQPVSRELALTGEFPALYTEFEYHLVHCTFMWRKMHLALLGKGKSAVDSVNAELEHTEHCAHMLLTRREVPLDYMNAIILVKFPDCGIA